MEKKKRKEEEGSKQNGDAKKKTRRYGGTGVWDCRSQCCGAGVAIFRAVPLTIFLVRRSQEPEGGPMHVLLADSPLLLVRKS